MQGQLATYKEMAAAAEADRSRLEQEVLATAQLATSLEARLRTALAARDGAEARIAAAEMKAYEVRCTYANPTQCPNVVRQRLLLFEQAQKFARKTFTLTGSSTGSTPDLPLLCRLKRPLRVR